MKLTNANNIVCAWFCRSLFASVAFGLLGSLCLGQVDAFAAFQPDLLVKLASQPDASYVGNGVFESPALTQAKSQAAFPGIPASFTVQLKNAGDQQDSFRVSGAGLAGVGVRFLDQEGIDRAASLAAGFVTPPVAAGRALTFQLQVNPLAFVPGTSFRVTISAASIADGTRSDQLNTDTVACSAKAALAISAPPDASGAPGSVVNYPYTVTNTGNADNSFALTVSSPAGWDTALYADDGVGGGVPGDGVRQPGEKTATASTGLLAPGASYRFFVAVAIPAGSGDGTRGATQLTAAGGGTNGSDQVTTSALAANLSLVESVRNLTQGGVFVPGIDAFPGDLLEYRMAVTNSGSTPATLVGIRAPLPANTALVPASLRVATSATGEGGACAEAVCGRAGEAQGSLVAKLGSGASQTAGGTLAPGSTLYVFFRVKVE